MPILTESERAKVRDTLPLLRKLVQQGDDFSATHLASLLELEASVLDALAADEAAGELAAQQAQLDELKRSMRDHVNTGHGGLVAWEDIYTDVFQTPGGPSSVAHELGIEWCDPDEGYDDDVLAFAHAVEDFEL